jgi:hypothetical protein
LADKGVTRTSYLAVDAFVEKHTQRPPIALGSIALAAVYFGREVG